MQAVSRWLCVQRVKIEARQVEIFKLRGGIECIEPYQSTLL
jgi:hypothetical protein